MTAKNGNGVVLASGKAKGATGVAAVLTMLATLTNTEYFAGVMRRVAQSSWNDFWEEDWQMEYTIRRPSTQCKIQLNIGERVYLLIESVCSAPLGTSLRITVKRMSADKPETLSPRPYEFVLSGDAEEDDKQLSEIIGVLVRTLGVRALDGEPDFNPFSVGVVY